MNVKLRPAVGGSTSDPVLPFDNRPVGSLQAFEILTISEVAEFLKISVSGVRRLQQQRQLPFIKVGGSVRFDAGDVTEYLERQRVESISAK